MGKITCCILGYGNRGKLYADFIHSMPDAECAAVCDTNPRQLLAATEIYGMKVEQCFTSEGEFLEKKRGDILIVASLDRDHYRQVMRGLELGYDILLEKPISVNWSECAAIEKAAVKLRRKVAVCHVLRYTKFYSEIKNIIDSGEIGDVVTVTQTENVAYWHQAHSFVRGNWRDTNASAPMILAKCCHDLDILSWLCGRDCLKISSFGSLNFFKEECAPQNSADYCYKCPARSECPYNCIRFYTENPGWFNVVKANSQLLKSESATSENSPELIEKVLSDEQNPYSRCVFKCDNDAVDHQVVNMLFDGGVTAQLTMTAFSQKCTRVLHIHGTYGEIFGDFEDRKFTVNVFGKSSRVVDIAALTDDFSGHGGGDKIMFADFLALVGGGAAGKGLTSISKSVLSHKMAFAAERSRNAGGKVIKL